MTGQLDAEFTAIRDGLRRLREAAPLPKVFGAETHGFRTHPPLTEGAVRAFEARHSVALPPEYRGFLIHVGNGGAGPFYGVLKLGHTDGFREDEPWVEDGWAVGDLPASFPHAGPWNDLSAEPFAEDHDEEEYERLKTEWEDNVYWNAAVVNGSVPICHRGCALRQWLVLTGPEAGHVWDDLRVDTGGLVPVGQSRRRVTFLMWYRAWLDEALAGLA